VCAAVSKPVNVLTSGRSVEELAGAGVKRISLGGGLSRAALGALLRAAHEIQEHGTFNFLKDAVPHREINAMMADR
jgi:2-methylisocitrate lyase-like PEP mutase family enzyme